MSDEQRLAEAKKIMDSFKKQTEMMQGNMQRNMQPNIPSTNQPGEFDNQGGGDFVQHGVGNSVGIGFDNQSENNPVNLQTTNPKANVMTSPSPPKANVITSPSPPQSNMSVIKPPSASISADVCPQCKTMHPPLQSGQKCPNVGIEDKANELGIDDSIINKHLVNMRDIIISNMESKQIKDGKKFFQYAVVELTKALELYESS